MEQYRALLKKLEREGYLKTPRIIEAFYAIDRKDFVPAGMQADAYIDAPLSIGKEQTISQPLTVAFMLELLQPESGDVVLDVGAGSGWTATLLANIVNKKNGNDINNILEKVHHPDPLKGGEGSFATADSLGLLTDIQNDKRRGRVVAVERIPELAEFGKKNVSRYNFIKKGVVKFLCGNAIEEAVLVQENIEVYDKILSGAAAHKEIPEVWKRHLRIGGRIVAPINDYIVKIDKVSDSEYAEERFYGFRFVPLVKDSE